MVQALSSPWATVVTAGFAAVMTLGRWLLATITAPTTLTNGGPVVVGDDDGSCAGNKLTGPVNITGNTAGVEFDGNTASGPLTITGNTGTLQPPDFGTLDATNNTLSGPVNIPH
jgi:5'-nucleotidase